MEKGAKSRSTDEGKCCAQAIPLWKTRLPLRKKKMASGHDRNEEYVRENSNNSYSKGTRSYGTRMG